MIEGNLYRCLGHKSGDAFYPTYHGLPKQNSGTFKVVTKAQNNNEFVKNPCSNFTVQGSVYICKGHMLSFHGDLSAADPTELCSNYQELKPNKFECLGHEYGCFKSPSYHGHQFSIIKPHL